MKTPERFSIRVGETMLPFSLPIDRADRIARRAVSKYGKYDLAEIIGPGGETFISYLRLDNQPFN